MATRGRILPPSLLRILQSFINIFTLRSPLYLFKLLVMNILLNTIFYEPTHRVLMFSNKLRTRLTILYTLPCRTVNGFQSSLTFIDYPVLYLISVACGLGISQKRQRTKNLPRHCQQSSQDYIFSTIAEIAPSPGITCFSWMSCYVSLSTH